MRATINANAPQTLNGILTVISDTGVTQKAPAAKRGNVETMLWVDHDSYFGPDRRRKPTGLRMRERRRYDLASTPPSLPIAMRQLRFRVIDARGKGAALFAERAQATAVLAQMQREAGACDALSSIARTAARGVDRDVRPSLYEGLDRAHAALH
jgi:hypothetical protein